LWFEEARNRLERGLVGPLPGSSAQILLAPRPRAGWQPDHVPDGCRDAAGLVLVYPVDGEACLVLTKRRHDLPQHAGQVSLPGGAVEPDETIEQGALREAHEEIDLDPRRVSLVGRLSPLHIPVSQFVLHPVVGLADARPVLSPHDREVERVLECPLRHLGDPANCFVETRYFRGDPYEVPYIGIEGEKLWGATAMIVAEMLFLVGFRPSPWGD